MHSYAEEINPPKGTAALEIKSYKPSLACILLKRVYHAYTVYEYISKWLRRVCKL